ncbi:hypothetical protein CQA66_03215 [Helicobacter aurati]|uniref:Uncharacterized protein n=1 Tax=Helicobacter aurati TaxID=137778 RepID=A0A3D8J5Z0_9HELI|nr:hypothetical protein [Helicobacter aurati]RDU72909.1 hypothetical protein CQA66_03215 [Helicobacter aurati]
MSSKKLDVSLAKIESLKASSYEKDVIRSAFYNHLNKIPLSAEVQRTMRKYNISFAQQDIVVGNSQALQNRKNHYKRTYQPQSIEKNHTTRDTKVYKRSYLDSSDNKSQQLIVILQEANVLRLESDKLLAQCKDILVCCFTANELSYGMITSLITNITDSFTRNTQALQEFLTPFLDMFDGLHDGAKEEILQKANVFLQTMRDLKEIATNLCIKLSAIRAKSVLKQESGINDYLEDTIQKMEAYLK